MVILHSTNVCGIPTSDTTIQAEVYLAAKSKHSVVFMLRPPHTSTSGLVWASLAAQQLAHQMTTKWPELSSFLLRRGSLPALGTAIIAQLTTGNWSSLEYLYLSDCALTAGDLSLLIEGKWPALRKLDVSQNCLNADSMAVLAKGNWPLLRDISFNSNSTLDAVALAHLSTANWPLETLWCSYVPFTTGMAAELAKLQLPNLASIFLNGAFLTAAAVSELVRADWPTLRHLSLSHWSDLDATAMRYLCVMPLPVLEVLQLTDVNMTEEGAYQLAQGAWPLLRQLNLSRNQLDAKSVQHIASGIWPKLQDLSLEGNRFGHDGLRQMTKGNWPLLKRLTIDLKMLLQERNSAVLLGLDYGKVQEFESDASPYIMRLHRISQARGGMWVNLHEVTVLKF